VSASSICQNIRILICENKNKIRKNAQLCISTISEAQLSLGPWI